MSKKVLGIIVWFLGFALSIFLLMIVPVSYTTSIWVTFVFDVIAFVSQLLLMVVVLFKEEKGVQGTYYRLPTVTVSMIYMVIQFVICIIMGVAGGNISLKVALIINLVLCIIMWILIVLLCLAKSHFQRIDSRQKNHHKQF